MQRPCDEREFDKCVELEEGFHKQERGFERKAGTQVILDDRKIDLRF